MINFNNDYTELAHPRLLNKLVEINMDYDKPYGFDSYCEQAQDLIRKRIKNEKVDVHFISGGTQTNLTAIASALYTHECIISTDIAHINSHETGAIEATGHKIYTIPHQNGKLDLKACEEFFNSTVGIEYYAVPKLVCITNATEFGTYYSKTELTKIYDFCKKNDLYLFIDGARMAFAMAAEGNDVDYSDLPNLCDMFYIGGTKNGALLGEALVLVNEKLKRNFKAIIKQRGALLAKGRVIGAQFYEFFKDGLYEELGANTNKQADLVRKAFKDNGYELYLENDTNLVFAILENRVIKELQNKYIFSVDSKIDENRTLVRFVTSWATKIENVEELAEDLKKLK